MFNPIFLFSALSGEMIKNSIDSFEKCSISGKVENIKIKSNKCLDNVEITINNNDNYYLINSSKYNQNECIIDNIGIIYNDENLLNIGDEINFLVRKNDYFLLSDKNNLDRTYSLISGENYVFTGNTCESNYQKYNINIVFGLIFLFIILAIIILKIFKK